MIGRRQAITRGAALAVASRFALGLHHTERQHYGIAPARDVPPIDDARMKQLILRGVDAIRHAGGVGTYGDVRLTHIKDRTASGMDRAVWEDGEAITVGVRALVNGYWGFASGPVCTPDELARLGRVAVQLAKANALGPARPTELAPVPVVQDKHWVMPVVVDPFDVSREEIADFCVALYDFGNRYSDWRMRGKWVARFTVVDKAFGSTDGSYWTQRMFATRGSYAWGMMGRHATLGGSLDTSLSVAGAGWERFRDQPLRERVRELHAELVEDTSIPTKPVVVGRYDAVFDPLSLVDLVNGSLGAATQLDRAMGYEANAGGTSYLSDPSTMLGVFKVGAPALTVTANRNAPGGVNTVQWDDEGVVPETFTVVDKGLLANYATTREGAGWIRSSSSRGCAAAPRAVDIPLTHTPNLVMSPGAEDIDLSGLIAGLGDGIMVKRGSMTMDFQQQSAYAKGTMYEVKHGKRVALLGGGAMLIRATEFWNALQALGGPRSVVRLGAESEKGEPPQRVANSADIVPVSVKGVAVIEAMKKA